MIGVIFGGNSLEHDVSIASGKDILKEVGGREFYLDESGVWFVDGEVSDDVVASLKECMVIFPIIHGSPGEDGTLQGFLEMNNIPYVGCDVVSSAVCMDKDFTKRILQTHNIPVTSFTTYYTLEQALKAEIKGPCVIKATSLGSSFGVHVVKDDPTEALKDVFALGKKAIVEEFVKGREFWCSVLEMDGQLIASSPGEICFKSEIFTYENKYKPGGTTYRIPPKDAPIEEIKELAKKAFRVLGCSGFARVDFFYTDDGSLLVNELNTLPGFTRNSLFLKSFAADGLSYKEVIEALIHRAKQTHATKDSFQAKMVEI